MSEYKARPTEAVKTWSVMLVIAYKNPDGMKWVTVHAPDMNTARAKAELDNPGWGAKFAREMEDAT